MENEKQEPFDYEKAKQKVNNPNPTAEEAAQFIRNVVQDLTQTMNDNPGVKTNDLFQASTSYPEVKNGVIQGAPGFIKANSQQPSTPTVKPPPKKVEKPQCSLCM
jgi:hypothetical protein